MEIIIMIFFFHQSENSEHEILSSSHQKIEEAANEKRPTNFFISIIFTITQVLTTIGTTS